MNNQDKEINYRKALEESGVLYTSDLKTLPSEILMLWNLFQQFSIDYFYKYVSMKSVYTKSNLEKDVFHFSSINNLNDLSEFSFAVDIENEKKKREELLTAMTFIDEPSQDEVNDFLSVNEPDNALKRVKEKTFIYSLTTTYANPVMWASYANNFDGICIAYNARDLFSRFLVQLSPVIYSDKRVIVPYQSSRNEIIKYISRVATTKHTEWSYEKEWRIVHIDLKSDETIHNDTIKPSSITYGPKVFESDREFLKEICKKKSISLYSLKYDEKNDRFYRKIEWEAK